MKSRKVGPSKKRERVEVDLTGLPADLVAAVLEAAPCPVARREQAARASAAAAAKVATARAERAAAHQAINDQPGMLKRNSGAGARILEAAADWITAHELRVGLGMARGLLTRNLDRLWRNGELDKRLNPGRAENVGLASGAAACTYQFRRAQKETAD